MRLHWLWIGALALGGVGCGDDGGAGGGDGSSSSTAGDTGTTAVAEDSTGAPMGTAGSSGGGSGEGGSSSSGGPPTEVTLSGDIQDYFAMSPIADAEISLLSDATVSTVSDARGLWSLSGLTPNTYERIVVAGNDTYWGALVPAEIGDADDDSVQLSQVSVEVVDIQEGALQQQEPTVIVDETKAAILVVLRQPTAIGPAGGPVVEMDPPAPPNTYYAPDPSIQPILNENEITLTLYPVMVFFNVEPGPEGAFTLSATHPDRECTLVDPSPPTFERTINLIYLDCLPPA